MAESEKGPVSSANVKKRSASFDEDFGKDFLSPWKSSKLGKDAIDFDVGTVSRNGKKIYFDKLDDFELGGDFDKISSFKMDMSDLDFSSPLKKTEKPNEKSCKELVLGKKEPTKENFSFTFDFNELSMFGLDPKLVTKANEASKLMDDASAGGSVMHDKDLLSRSNSIMKIDIVESDQIHTLPKKASMDTSKPTHLIEQDTVKSHDPSTSSNLSCDGMCHEAHISPGIHTPMTEENVEVKRIGEDHGKTADDSLPARQFSEKTAQDFSLLSVSCDDLVQPTLSNMHTVVSTSEHGKANLGREQDNCTRSIVSSQSRNASPVNSYHSRGWQSAYKSESPSISTEYQKNERNKRDICRSASLESTEHRKDLVSTSAREFSDRLSHGTKNSGEKQNSNTKLPPSPLHRELRQSDEQAENKYKGLLNSINKPATQGAPDVIRTESENLSSSFHLQLSNLVGPTITSSTNKNLRFNIIPNRKFMKSSSSVSSELQGTPPKDGKQALLSSLAAFRVRKLNGNDSSSGVLQGAKPKDVLNKGAPLRMISSVTNSAIKKHALLSPPLKRKTVEDSVPESDALYPIKFIMNSPTKRRMLPEIATRSTNEMVLGSETAEAFDSIPFNSPHEIGSLLDFEVPILVENDKNVEKAEACTRELEGICSMLKKKNEEAKELLVRAMVNNNALLMLNHPMFDEKIRVLQRFATSMRSKYSI